MKVIKVRLSWDDVNRMERLADDLNGNDDIAALRVEDDEYYIATEGELSMRFVRNALARELSDYKIRAIK